MLAMRVGLVDRTGKIPFEQISRVAAAINLQFQRDFAPIWHLVGTVTGLPDAASIPSGVCPVFVVNNLPPDEGGVHLTKHNQPYALVEAGEGWTLAASHECLEMLADPGGNRLYASTAIQIDQRGAVADAPGKFEYLVEVCDPSEDPAYAYLIDDVQVSDFYTPHYFDPVSSTGVRYSFTGAITRPREVLKGGYLSWVDPERDVIQQMQVSPTGAPKIADLGPAQGASLRVFVDGKAKPTARLSRAASDGTAYRRREQLAAQGAARARFYR